MYYVNYYRDTLRIREAKIFSAVLRWSEAECIRRQLPVTPGHQRMVLGRAFNAIRFPLMSVEEFAMGPAQSGLLDDREIVQLFLYFTVNPKPNVGFLDTPRCCMTGKELTVNRFPQTESRWGYSGTTDRIRFTVDQRIFIVGFGLYGSYFGPTEYEVHLQVSCIKFRCFFFFFCTTVFANSFVLGLLQLYHSAPSVILWLISLYIFGGYHTWLLCDLVYVIFIWFLLYQFLWC